MIFHVIPEKDPYGHWLQGKNQGIAASQHKANSLTAPAGNTFTDRANLLSTWNYFNHDYCNMILYHHHIQESPPPPGLIIVPDPRSIKMIDLSQENVNYVDEEHACPSNLGGNGTNLNLERSSMLSENERIDNYKDTIQLVKDGGDTYGLNLDVYSSNPGEGYQIQEQLLEESPYLSDTVIKSAIYKENVLTNAMLRDVLVANPQSAKSTEILDKIEDRIDPMPEEMMGEILEGRNIKGALEILEDSLASHTSSKYKSLHKLESYYKNDTLDISGSNDSLTFVWSQENDPSILYKLAFLHLYNNDSLNCFSTLDLIPQQTNLSQQDQEEYDEYSELMNLLWGLRNGNSALDSLVEEQLISLCSNDSKPCFIARNVLIANGKIDYIEPIYVADNLKSLIVFPERPKKEISNDHRLKVHPNPANDYIIVSYDLTGLKGDFQIVITSSEGKPIIKRSLTGVKNQIIISTAQISSSMYVITLVQGIDIIESMQIIITR